MAPIQPTYELIYKHSVSNLLNLISNPNFDSPNYVFSYLGDIKESESHICVIMGFLAFMFWTLLWGGVGGVAPMFIPVKPEYKPLAKVS